MSPEEIREKLGLEPFDEWYDKQDRQTWKRCRAESGYNARKEEHRRKYGYKEGFCQKCTLEQAKSVLGREYMPCVKTKRHARWCPSRGLGHVARKQYVIARRMHEVWKGDPRQTGRTTKALIRLAAECSQKRKVLLLVHSEAFARDVLGKITRYAAKGVPVNAGYFDIGIIRYPVMGMRYDAVIVDHFALSLIPADRREKLVQSYHAGEHIQV